MAGQFSNYRINLIFSLLTVVMIIGCQPQQKKESKKQSEVVDTLNQQNTVEQNLVSGTDPFIKYYEGNIGGKLAISMKLLSWGDGTIDGTYQYKKVGEDIDLIGELQLDETFVLREYSDFDATGKFKGSLTEPAHLTGTWQNIDSTKILSFELKEIRDATLDQVGWTGTWYLKGENGGGRLIIGNVTASTFDFGISVVRGGHVGVIFDQATYSNKSGTFNKVVDGPGDPCILRFDHNGDHIQISQKSGPFECGFGARAYADGKFSK